jgi:Na+-driven multidrug efflux pump
MIAGVINVLLNLFFVIVLRIGVAGVAIATVASQAISAGLVLHALFTYDGCLRLDLKELRIHGRKLGQMVRIGLPAGIQGSFFSISNVLIQSSINSFGDMAMTGNAAAQNIEGYVYVGMNAFHHTTLSFTSQNYGGGKYDRILKVVRNGLLFVMTTGLGLGLLAYTLREPLLNLYISDEPGTPTAEIISYGIKRMTVIMFTYFTCGTMDVLVGGLRGLGKSIPPMLITLGFVCLMRIVWIYTVFSRIHTLECLYISYPVSWTLATLVQGGYFLITYFKLMKRVKAQ